MYENYLFISDFYHNGNYNCHCTPEVALLGNTPELVSKPSLAFVFITVDNNKFQQGQKNLSIKFFNKTWEIISCLDLAEI